MAAAIATTETIRWEPGLVALYEQHHEGLVRIAKRSVCSWAVAEEIVHDVFVAFHSRRCAPRPGRELAYLRTMVRNRGHSVTRRAMRGEELTKPERHDVPTPEDRCLAKLDAEAVNRAMSGLTERQRAVMTLRYQHGLSEAEIASKLGVSRGSVKTHAMRARRSLAECLRDTTDNCR